MWFLTLEIPVLDLSVNLTELTLLKPQPLGKHLINTLLGFAR